MARLSDPALESPRKDSESHCSPKSTSRSKKRKLFDLWVVCSNGQLLGLERTILGNHFQCVGNKNEKKHKTNQPASNSLSKACRPGVCFSLWLGRYLHHSAFYPSMGLWRWFRACLWTLSSTHLFINSLLWTLSDMHSDRASHSDQAGPSRVWKWVSSVCFVPLQHAAV